MKCDPCPIAKTDPAHCETCWAAPMELKTNPDRCPSCGTLPTVDHLKNCTLTRRPGGENRDKPTPKMIDLARQLQSELGIYGEEYPEQLTYDRCHALIDRLLKEKEEGLYERDTAI